MIQICFALFIPMFIPFFAALQNSFSTGFHRICVFLLCAINYAVVVLMQVNYPEVDNKPNLMVLSVMVLVSISTVIALGMAVQNHKRY